MIENNKKRKDKGMELKDIIKEKKRQLEKEIQDIKKDVDEGDAAVFWQMKDKKDRKLKKVHIEEGHKHPRNVKLESEELQDEMKFIILRKRLKLLENNLNQLQNIENRLEYDGWSAVAKWFGEKYDLLGEDYARKTIRKYYIEKTKYKKGRKPFAFGDLDKDYYESDKIMISSEDVDMRSKSELVIAEKLREYGINFEYEQTLIMDGQKWHPDFFIIKDNGEFVIWEHIGRTFDDQYLEKQISKLIEYKRHGFVLWKNLIVTFDGENGSFDVNEVEFKIKNNLLK